MSVQSPWSVKGVQPKTREAAKDLARREGLTLGEWLNRLIGDVDEDGDVVASRENTPNYAPQSQGPSYHPQPVYGHEPPRAYAQPLAPFPDQPPMQPHAWPPRETENSRLTAALEQLTRRLDLTQAPVYPPPPVSTYQPSLSNALVERVEEGERRAETALGRIDASLSDVRQTQAALAERLRVMELNDPNHKSLAALRGLESALARLSQQVFDIDARSDALESRIDAKVAEATSKFAPDTGLGDRIGAIEQVTKDALETLDTSVSLISQRLASTESMAGDINSRFADAMIDLSARITGVEQKGDDPTTANRLENLNQRLAGMEDVTTQAIESVDKGLGLVSERVAATEALAQATNERLVEALIDLSARLVKVENIDSQESARELLNALEAKNKELTRRLENLDNKIDATREELTQEVQSALAAGVDGRMAEIAKALADRLDVSERRSGEALEKIGAEMARASISLDQRLREVEDRGTNDVATAMRNEMSRMARAIDERMAAMERRDAAALDQAGGHLLQLAQSLSDKLDASEARAQTAVQTVSSQMEQLAQRLQARQDETAQNLVSRIEEGEARNHQQLQTSLSQITNEIRSAEDRAKAVSAPLHRDFSALVDRLDQVEATGRAPYAESITLGDGAVTIGSAEQFSDRFAADYGPERGRDAFGSPPVGNAFDATPNDEFSFGEAYAPLTTNDAPRRPGFGAPFPGTDTDGLSQFEPSAASFDTGALDGFDEDPFSMSAAPEGASAVTAKSVEALDFADDLDESWSQPVRSKSSGSNDYLANARNAASRAAAESNDLQKSSKKKPALGAAKKKSAKTTKADMLAVQDKSKPILSPVGMVAAAGLVITTGMIGINYLNRDKSQNEMPSALNQPAPPAAAPTNGVTPDGVQPNEAMAPMVPVAPTEQAASVPQAGVPASAPDVTPPAVAPPKTLPPAAAFVPPAAKQPLPQPTVTPPKAAPRAEVTPSQAMRRFADQQNAKAQEAVARAKAAEDRLRPVAPPVKAAPAVRPAPVAPRQVAALSPNPAPIPQIATPQARQAATGAPATVAAPVPSRTPPPRVAVAPAQRPAAPSPAAAPAANAAPAAGGTPRQLYDQALARQQAGDATGAAQLMRAAADTGDARAINRLAKMYERGEGVARDPAQARALTERAAARGSRQAMHNLGVYYAEGEGPQRDFNKAAENFRRAANRGVADSQFNLGAMAEQGLGGDRSDRDAYYWYSIAGRNGDRDGASKSRELGARLTAAEKAAEDQRIAAFRADTSGDD